MMMKLCLLFFPFFLISCQGHVQIEKSPAEYVNPFIDTHKSRWFFFSSASRPFGMVNLSPDTNVDGSWKSGYMFDSTYVRCFSHVHAWQLSGIPVMPTVGDFKGHLGMEAYKSSFSHKGEIAVPGYHKLYLEDKKKIRPVTIALTTCGLVILVTLLISFVRAVFIPRYMLPMLGLFIFALAYVLAVEKSRIVKIVICAGLIGLTIWNGITLWNKSYSEENSKPIEAIKAEVQENDIFVYTTIGPSSSVAIEFNKNQQYFYNKDNWTVEKAYGAFAPQMKVVNNLEEIENYTGRIWVIDAADSNMYDYISEMEGTNIIKNKEEYSHPFSGDKFIISLFEKK